ncbi:MAG: hypothetical protein HGA45_37075, partial [Chloroflexales bacterium]|nr:hypothetical protein [Chloroflexales bacterium]
MAPPQPEPPLGPLELTESARAKYTLALARARRGPPELALLSLHGSLEDILRAHALRLHLRAAQEPFPLLLDALVTAEQAPLSAAEADSIKRMHRLRARVAHGEQIAVTRETIDAYHRLTARLLPRYGVVVVSPDDMPPAATTTTTPGRRADPTAVLRRETMETRQRGDTLALDRELGPPPPRRERTVYPDDKPARYAGRALPSAATRDLPLAREMLGAQRPRRASDSSDLLGQAADFWRRRQAWLLPALILVCIFLIGVVISAGLQMRAAPVAPTAAVSVPTLAPPPPMQTAPPGAITTPAPGGP